MHYSFEDSNARRLMHNCVLTTAVVVYPFTTFWFVLGAGNFCCYYPVPIPIISGTSCRLIPRGSNSSFSGPPVVPQALI